MVMISFSALTYRCSDNVNIWMVGDSTMADKKPDAAPETGWGMIMQEFCNEKATVRNHSLNGRSSKSFITEGHWARILDSLEKGDYVIIQFGHNDEKPDTARHTDPFTTYKQTLRKYIDDTRSKEGVPVICSSIVRRHFDNAGNLRDTHGEYITAAREIAEETNTAFIDMEALTRKMVIEAGQEKSKEFFLFCAPGEFENRPEGARDSTHLSAYGARKVAGLFAERVKELNLTLAGLLR